MVAAKRVLIVEDDKNLAESLETACLFEGWEPFVVADGSKCLDTLKHEAVDVILLDVFLPNMDGFDTLHSIRDRTSTPVIMLSVLTEASNAVKSFDLGANDYVRKPFSTEELIARIRVMIGRRALFEDACLQSFSDGDLIVDFLTRRVTRNGRDIKLTPTEFGLLKELIINEGRTLTYSDLLRRIWGPEYGVEKEYVYVIVNRLRAKLESDGVRSKHIHTVTGVGYFLRRVG